MSQVHVPAITDLRPPRNRQSQHNGSKAGSEVYFDVPVIACFRTNVRSQSQDPQTIAIAGMENTATLLYPMSLPANGELPAVAFR